MHIYTNRLTCSYIQAVLVYTSNFYSVRTHTHNHQRTHTSNIYICIEREREREKERKRYRYSKQTVKTIARKNWHVLNM